MILTHIKLPTPSVVILTSLTVSLVVTMLAFGRTNTMDNVMRTQDVVYGHKAGMALTLDVFEPAHKNGAGVIFLVSGGWASSHDDLSMVHVTPEFYSIYLARGYTVFAVVHGSMPRFNVPDIILDVQRAVRFIRHNAAHYGVDPNRLGVLGSSSGGHLALMIATQGGPGPAISNDPVDHESSAGSSLFLPANRFSELGRTGCRRGRTRPFSAPVRGFWIAIGYGHRTSDCRKNDLADLLCHIQSSAGLDHSRRRRRSRPASAIGEFRRQGQRSGRSQSQNHCPKRKRPRLGRFLEISGRCRTVCGLVRSVLGRLR